MPAAYIADLADELLDAAEAALDQSRTGVPLPDRRYVSATRPPADCEQLVVYLAADEPVVFRNPGSLVGAPSPPEPCAVLPVARFWVDLLRCWPTVEDGASGPIIPSEDQLAAASRQAHIDLWAFVTGILTEWSERTLFASVDDCGNVAVLDAEAIVPAGGYAGWRLPVAVALNDLGPSVGS